MSDVQQPYEPESLAHVAHGRQPLRFCGVRESLIEEARRKQFQWRTKRHLRYFIADRIPGIPMDAYRATLAAAFGVWPKVCGLTIEETAQQSLANIIVLTRPIDGNGGTLAEAELPPGDDRTLRMWLDLNERWHASVNLSGPTSAALIDLLAVAAHEAGHLIGLSHEQTRSVKALLDPFYDPAVRGPLEWDIEQAQRRYGPPVAQPPEPTPIPAGIDFQCTINGVLQKPVTLFPV